MDADMERLAKAVALELAPLIEAMIERVISDKMQQMADTQDTLLSAKEMAKCIGVSESTFFRKRYQDILPGVTIHGGAKQYLKDKGIAMLMALSGN